MDMCVAGAINNYSSQLLGYKAPSANFKTDAVPSEHEKNACTSFVDRVAAKSGLMKDLNSRIIFDQTLFPTFSGRGFYFFWHA